LTVQAAHDDGETPMPTASGPAATATAAPGAGNADGVPGPVTVQTATAPASPSPAAAAAPASGGPAGSATGDVDALAQRLFPAVLRRIKAEFLLDRERRGVRTDPW
jgi:hypothetical protein